MIPSYIPMVIRNKWHKKDKIELEIKTNVFTVEIRLCFKHQTSSKKIPIILLKIFILSEE